MRRENGCQSTHGDVAVLGALSSICCINYVTSSVRFWEYVRKKAHGRFESEEDGRGLANAAQSTRESRAWKLDFTSGIFIYFHQANIFKLVFEI